MIKQINNLLMKITFNIILIYKWMILEKNYQIK